MTASRGRARIGVLVPFTNTNLEPDLTMVRPDGISFHFARLGGYDADEIPDDKQMAGMGAATIDEPLRMIAGVKPDIVMYGCTSATLIHGVAFDRELAVRIQEFTDAATITAAGALVHALKSLGATCVGFASPYVGAINEQAVSFLADAGIETVNVADVGKALGNYGQGELTPDEVFALGKRADHPTAEAIAMSCTDMRSIEMIDRLEAELGKPVVSSNQAMLFEALEMLDIRSSGIRCGRLIGGEAAPVSGRLLPA
ncbi:MAG: Asp/Glu racemase [Rhizobiales bacterium]|nr:Asp/Glu racemase [Hyphomicrobiales bacterium]